MLVISDMCFCEYTDHGHCGIINSRLAMRIMSHRCPKGTC
jgi:delta-aminolevulinic acid dehydratase/porphobilinogen synthase